MPDRLIIVYNANEGWASALMDAAHKLVRPETYGCSLCMVSYGPVSMRRDWRTYLDSLPATPDFYHRQDFARAYPALADAPLPAILLERHGRVKPLLGPEQLDAIDDVAGLIAATDRALYAVSH